MRVGTVRNGDQLHAIRPEWEALSRRSVHGSVFSTPAWLYPFIDSYQPPSIAVLAVRDDSNTLRAILPLSKKRFKPLPIPGLSYYAHLGGADYHDILIERGYEQHVMPCLMHWLRTDKDRLRNVIDLNHVSYNVNTSEAQPLLFEFGIRYPRLNLPTTYQALSQPNGDTPSQHASIVKKAAQYERQLRRSYPTTIIELADVSSYERVLDALFDLHQQRWQTKGKRGVLSGHDTQQFMRMCSRELLANGWLRLTYIQTDKIIAVIYCISFQGVSSYFISGIDPDYSKFSLGTILMANSIKQAIADGDTTYDMLKGGEAYKDRWADEITYPKRCVFPSYSLLDIPCLPAIWLDTRFKALEDRLRHSKQNQKLRKPHSKPAPPAT